MVWRGSIPDCSFREKTTQEHATDSSKEKYHQRFPRGGGGGRKRDLIGRIQRYRHGLSWLEGRQTWSVGVVRFASTLEACVSPKGEWRVGARQRSDSAQILYLLRRWRNLLAAEEPCTNSHYPDLESQAGDVFEEDDPLLKLLRTQDYMRPSTET